MSLFLQSLQILEPGIVTNIHGLLTLLLRIPAFSPGQKCSAWTHSEKIGPSTGSVNANFPHPAFHPCVSTLLLEGPSLEVREEESCLQQRLGPRKLVGGSQNLVLGHVLLKNEPGRWV